MALPACRNPIQVAGLASLRLTAKLTANPPYNRGSWRIALDGYIRPELGRRGQRWLPEQLTSPGVEEPNGVGRNYAPWNSRMNHGRALDDVGIPVQKVSCDPRPLGQS
jgi:hypothetical protein